MPEERLRDVADAAAEYLRAVQHDRNRNPSRNGPRSIIDAHLRPDFEEIQVEQVRSGHIDDWLSAITPTIESSSPRKPLSRPREAVKLVGQRCPHRRPQLTHEFVGRRPGPVDRGRRLGRVESGYGADV